MKPGRLIVTYSFFVCLFLMIAGIISAKNTSQLLSSLIFLPLIFYFATVLFRQKRILTIKLSKKTTTQRLPEKLQTKITETAVETEPVVDVPDNNKRLFLKLIGSAGFSLLLMALFTKKAQASFFGSAPTGPGIVSIKDKAGNKIDPAEKRPTDGYEISNMDTGGSIEYYGFVKKTGEWYVMKKDAGNFSYTKGASNYATSWSTRNSLTYDYFNNIFG